MTGTNLRRHSMQKTGSVLLATIVAASVGLSDTAQAMYEYCAAFDPPEVGTDTAMVMYHECTELLDHGLPLASESESSEAVRDTCGAYASEYMRCCQLTNGQWYCPLAMDAGVVAEDKEDASDLMTIFLMMLP